MEWVGLNLRNNSTNYICFACDSMTIASGTFLGINVPICIPNGRLSMPSSDHASYFYMVYISARIIYACPQSQHIAYLVLSSLLHLHVDSEPKGMWQPKYIATSNSCRSSYVFLVPFGFWIVVMMGQICNDYNRWKVMQSNVFVNMYMSRLALVGAKD